MARARATRGRDGRFTGSVGAGRDQVPSPAHDRASAAQPAVGLTAAPGAEVVTGLYELFKCGHLAPGAPANLAAGQASDRFAGHGLDAGVVPAATQPGQITAALDRLDAARAACAGVWDEQAAAAVDDALALLGLVGAYAQVRRGEVADAWSGREG